MQPTVGVKLIIMWAASLALADNAGTQTSIGETLSGPDSHETGQGTHGHLLGDWGGFRSDLFERGVRFDFQYISDNLANIEGDRNDRFVSWDRVRGTVDIDLGTLTGLSGYYFHATALWQNGGNLGTYLGLLTSPSGMSSANTFRLDLYWMASQALWRVDPNGAKGLDATMAYDWSPPDINRNNSLLTAGLRFNEPLPLPLHNTTSLGYVHNHLSSDFRPNNCTHWNNEHGLEFNILLAFMAWVIPRRLSPGRSLIQRNVETEQLPWCRQENVGVIVYSPMASGLLSGAMTRERLAALARNDWRTRNEQFKEPKLSENLKLVERLRAVGDRHGRSPGETAIAWTLRHPAVTGAIVGARNSKQVDGIIGAMDFRLTPLEIAEMEGQ